MYIYISNILQDAITFIYVNYIIWEWLQICKNLTYECIYLSS